MHIMYKIPLSTTLMQHSRGFFAVSRRIYYNFFLYQRFNSCFRNLSAGNIRVQLVVLNSLCLVLMVFALMYTNNVHRTPPSHSQPYECKEDFGYGKASLEEIISGTAQQLDHPNFTYIRNANKTVYQILTCFY